CVHSLSTLLDTLTLSVHLVDVNCYSRPIPISAVMKCEEMGPDCPRVIFTIKKKKQVCVDPGVKWVQRIMKKMGCETVKT
uniref:Chemokine interleukin-8-like domain-containing protein n=1 Tax=Pygocentrus nattereri TaxID=42514 RepID=A0A3B4D672_PYGNA